MPLTRRALDLIGALRMCLLMLSRRQAILSVLSGLTAPLIGCGPPTYNYRRKLTIEVEVDGEIRSASSVVECWHTTKVFPENRSDFKVEGEALYIDLGADRKPLVALLTRRDWNGSRFGLWGAEVLAQAYGIELNWDGNRNQGLAALESKRGLVEIAVVELPDLVTFGDPRDPLTVERVDPNNLEEALDSDVRWHRIAIEVTDEPITTGLEKKLPWLATMNSQLDGKLIRYLDERKTVANMLGTSDFKRRRT